MPIHVQCECGREVVAPSEKAGAAVACPFCGREVAVPAAPGGAPAAPDHAAQPPPRHYCPFCWGPIDPRARKCPHCQEYLDPELAAARAPAPPVSRLAMASLAMGIVSPLLLCLPGPLAVLLGMGALVWGRGRKTRGKGMAIAGLVLGAFWTLVLVALLVASVYAAKEHPGFSSSREPIF